MPANPQEITVRLGKRCQFRTVRQIQDIETAESKQETNTIHPDMNAGQERKV